MEVENDKTLILQGDTINSSQKTSGKWRLKAVKVGTPGCLNIFHVILVVTSDCILGGNRHPKSNLLVLTTLVVELHS